MDFSYCVEEPGGRYGKYQGLEPFDIHENSLDNIILLLHHAIMQSDLMLIGYRKNKISA